MNYPVSQVSSARQNNPTLAATAETSRAPNFTRTQASASVDGSRNPQADGVKYTQIARGPAPANLRLPAQIQAPSRIPANPGPISPNLMALRGDCRTLMSTMSNANNPAFHQQGVPFMTHRGEPGLVKYDEDGMAAIHVNGKPTLKCFVENNTFSEPHILMRGPDERMYASRHLPEDYLQEGSALARSAQAGIAGQGQVQHQMRRWGH